MGPYHCTSTGKSTRLSSPSSPTTTTTTAVQSRRQPTITTTLFHKHKQPSKLQQSPLRSRRVIRRPLRHRAPLPLPRRDQLCRGELYPINNELLIQHLIHEKRAIGLAETVSALIIRSDLRPRLGWWGRRSRGNERQRIRGQCSSSR
jgi:hypothetical protein